MSIVVLGSANMDLVVRAPRIPAPGETLLGTAFATHPGGKGANQAVAAARLARSSPSEVGGGGANAPEGVQVHFIGAIGSDAFGQELKESLQQAGADTQHLQTVSGPSGIATITVADNGQNAIVVAPGANAQIDVEQAVAAIKALRPKILVAQLEVPIPLIQAVADATDAFFILNPAPAAALPPELLKRTDLLVPNESETQTLTGIAPTDDRSCRAAVEALKKQGVKEVLITLGSQGYFSKGFHYRAEAATPVDTTAAGDAFIGGLAFGLAHGHSPEKAARLAAGVAAVAVTRPGAQPSMPTLEEVLAAYPHLT